MNKARVPPLLGTNMQLKMNFISTKFKFFGGILDWTRDVTQSHVKRRWVTAWMKQLRFNSYIHTHIASYSPVTVYLPLLPSLCGSLGGDDCYVC